MRVNAHINQTGKDSGYFIDDLLSELDAPGEGIMMTKKRSFTCILLGKKLTREYVSRGQGWLKKGSESQKARHGGIFVIRRTPNLVQKLVKRGLCWMECI